MSTMRRSFLVLSLVILLFPGFCFAEINAEKVGKNSMIALLQQSGVSSSIALAPNEPIFQLHPPATKDEMTMYKKLKSTKPAEVAPFIATRKYFRQLKAWHAQFPDGKENWKQIPRPPAGINPDYALDFDEQLMYLQMQAALKMNDN